MSLVDCFAEWHAVQLAERYMDGRNIFALHDLEKGGKPWGKVVILEIEEFEDLQTELEEAQGDVDRMEQYERELAGEINELKAQRSDLYDEIKDLRKDIEELEDKLDHYEGGEHV